MHTDQKQRTYPCESVAQIGFFRILLARQHLVQPAVVLSVFFPDALVGRRDRHIRMRSRHDQAAGKGLARISHREGGGKPNPVA